MARSITDEEIGLIKAMLTRGKRNVDIQFFFNRPDRPANSGRISQIRNGTYGPDVPAASSADLDVFLAQNTVPVGGNPATTTISQRAAQKFEQRPDGQWVLASGETSEQECKEIFDAKKLSPIIRAIAAMANNKGGFIFIGVADAECRVVGLPNNTFANTDIVKLSEAAKKHLVPTPDFTKEVITMGGHDVGVIYVEKCPIPPVIVSRDGDKLDEGSILFRYPGQSAKIKFGDLHAMLQERDRASQANLLRSAHRLSEIGTENSLIVDTAAGTIETSDMQMMIDRKLADQLEFIKEGDFEEVDGAPTLRLVCDVKAVDVTGVVQERIEGRSLTADSVLKAFLNQERVRTPLDYVLVATQVQRQWLPLFYFVELERISTDAVIEKLEGEAPVYANSKSRALERLRNERTAFVQASGQAVPVLEKIQEGELDGLSDEFEVSAICRGICGLPNDFESVGPVLDILAELFEGATNDSTAKGHVFKAAARLDEISLKQ